MGGPEDMAVFCGGAGPVGEKQQILAYIDSLQEASSPGGMSLGRLGPVVEGLFMWTVVFAALIAAAVWIGIKAR